MEDRWDVINVVCIKPYKSLKVGSHYKINGRGDLQYNMDPEVNGRIGPGLCITDEYYGSFKNWWKLPFITDEEDYKSYLRDEKLKQLGI